MFRDRENANPSQDISLAAMLVLSGVGTNADFASQRDGIQRLGSFQQCIRSSSPGISTSKFAIEMDQSMPLRTAICSFKLYAVWVCSAGRFDKKCTFSLHGDDCNASGIVSLKFGKIR